MIYIYYDICCISYIQPTQYNIRQFFIRIILSDKMAKGNMSEKITNPTPVLLFYSLVNRGFPHCIVVILIKHSHNIQGVLGIAHLTCSNSFRNQHREKAKNTAYNTST